MNPDTVIHPDGPFRKLSHIILPTKKVYEEKPCTCGVEHGPHWVLKRDDPR